MGVAALKSVGFLVEARCGTPLNAYELVPEKVAMVVHQKDGQRSKISYLRLTPFQRGSQQDWRLKDSVLNGDG